MLQDIENENVVQGKYLEEYQQQQERMKIGQKATNQRAADDAEDGRNNNTGMMNNSQSQSFIR